MYIPTLSEVCCTPNQPTVLITPAPTRVWREVYVDWGCAVWNWGKCPGPDPCNNILAIGDERFEGTPKGGESCGLLNLAYRCNWLCKEVITPSPTYDIYDKYTDCVSPYSFCNQPEHDPCVEDGRDGMSKGIYLCEDPTDMIRCKWECHHIDTTAGDMHLAQIEYNHEISNIYDEKVANKEELYVLKNVLFFAVIIAAFVTCCCAWKKYNHKNTKTYSFVNNTDEMNSEENSALIL
eukprot:UN03173